MVPLSPQRPSQEARENFQRSREEAAPWSIWFRTEAPAPGSSAGKSVIDRMNCFIQSTFSFAKQMDDEELFKVGMNHPLLKNILLSNRFNLMCPFHFFYLNTYF
jgi:hypothetical protein